MRSGRSEQVMVRRVGPDAPGRRPDHLVVEEAMEVRLDGHLVATTMRTPGHDFELAVGLCHADGLLAGAAVRRVRYCGDRPAAESGYNVVTVDTGGVAPEPTPRLSATTSACGVCGTPDPADLRGRWGRVVPWSRPVEVLVEAARDVRGEQPLFAETGATHAAAVVEPDGSVSLVREDIGRHNAVDKVVGRLLLDDALPVTGRGLYVSGRASFEMVQKAWSAGFGAVVSISAPSALAVEVATAAGMVLVGFVRDGSANVYTAP